MATGTSTLVQVFIVVARAGAHIDGDQRLAQVKKLVNTEGTESVEIDMERDIVAVIVEQEPTFTEKQMAMIVSDAGFTLRGIASRPAGQSGDGFC